MIPLSNITSRMVKNIGVVLVGWWQSRRRTRVCGHRHTHFGYNQGRLGDKTLLEKWLLCVTGNDNEVERHAVVQLLQNKFSGTCVAMICAALNFLRFRNGQIRKPWHHSPMWQFWRRWELRMEYLRRWAKSSRCQLQGGGEEQKSQKEEKESEERYGKWYPGCRRDCVWLRHCRLTECDLLWRPMMRFSIIKWLSTFPRNGSFGVITVHGVQHREFALQPGYTKLIFWKAERQGFGMNLKKKLPGPTNNELIFLESSTFSSAVVPKTWSSLESQKGLSVQRQLRFSLKLHYQGFPCKVFYQIMKPPVLCRLCPTCAGQCYTVIHSGTLWDTLFEYWIMQQLYCHVKKQFVKFHLNIFTNGQVMPTEVNRCRECCSLC